MAEFLGWTLIVLLLTLACVAVTVGIILLVQAAWKEYWKVDRDQAPYNG